MTTTEDKTYNGWKNYETWVTKLWMDNDYNEYRWWSERARQAMLNAEGDVILTKRERAVLDLSEEIKDRHEERSHAMLEQGGYQASVFSDLMGAALSEVNWYEIAEALIEDQGEELSEEN